MKVSQLSPETKNILVKFMDYLAQNCAGQRGGVKKFLRNYRIDDEDAREAAKTGLSIFLSK